MDSPPSTPLPATPAPLGKSDSDGLGYWQRWLAAAGLIVLAAIAFAPALGCGFVLDDEGMLFKNPNMLSAAGIWICWTDPNANPDYYPMVYTSWWLEMKVYGGFSLPGFHAMNILQHGVGACLLWLSLMRLRVAGAWLIAALFAVHPVQVESVVWLAQRKNTLSGLFFFLSAWLFIRFWLQREGFEPSGTASAKWRWYALSLLCFVLAMLSKPVAMTLAAGLVVVMWWKRGGRLLWRDAWLAAPYFLLLIPMAMLTIWVQYHHVGGKTEGATLVGAQRVLVAGRAILFYLWKLVLPIDLCFSYPRWTVDPGVWWQWCFPIAAAVLFVAGWCLRRRIGPGPIASLVYFVAMLSPAMGFLDIYWFRFYYVVDHVQYLAMVGPAAFAVGVALRYTSTWPKWMKITAAGSVIAVLAALSIPLSMDYRNEETLWTATVQKNPQAWLAHSNLGEVLQKKGDYNGAVTHFQAAMRIPTIPPREPVKNGAMLLGDLGRFDEAVEALRPYVATHPSDGILTVMLGDMLVRAGRREDAAAVYANALEWIKPQEVDATAGVTAKRRSEVRCLRSEALVGVGRLDDAERLLREALAIDPSHPFVHFQHALVLLRMERVDDAIIELQAQLTRDLDHKSPNAWHLSTLALAMASSPGANAGSLALARDSAENANRMTQGKAPRYLEALGIVQAAQGDPTAAATLAAAANLAQSANFTALALQIADRQARVERHERVVLTGTQIAEH